MTHEGKGVAFGRQQLEGMINSADTSVHITAERRDRWREGGTERAREKDMWLRNRETVNTCERNTRRQQGGEGRKGRGEDSRMEGSLVAGQRQREKGVRCERCGLVGRHIKKKVNGRAKRG